MKIEREVQLEEGLQWEEIGTEKKWNKKVETKSKHRDMRRQQERGGKKSKKRRNRKTTLRMRNSRSSCASCILVSTSVCVFSVCVCVSGCLCGFQCPCVRVSCQQNPHNNSDSGCCAAKLLLRIPPTGPKSVSLYLGVCMYVSFTFGQNTKRENATKMYICICITLVNKRVGWNNLWQKLKV